ncbi:MAG TPA: oxygen-independent coproporphyrinogen III oxidase [Candidatus Omnitrophota bacterium]|nr:oxygen-independent coproporphyrinogen III oxidase [Candidatus Omnitrophota bacterium]
MLPQITKGILTKYDTPGPRYTSYPTAPEWSGEVTSQIYHSKLKEFGQSPQTLSLYVHIPFCESLCTFCGCTVAIRKQEPKHGDEYLEFLFKEIELVSEAIGTKKRIRQLHWGGGTPTFLSEDQMERLFKKIAENFEIELNGEIAVEIDPRTIDRSKLQKLRQLKFNRVSMGVQDFDPQVQEAVNRIQPFELVENCVRWCRELKFHSVNFDLIYGLPHQTRETFRQTIEKVLTLRPDRIALYSFAYVPWLKKHQSKLSQECLPGKDEKLEIFLQSREQLLKNGYQAIAMDHFALRTDEMSKAFTTGVLYRNFMGYTVKPADEYIGVGVSAIGFLENTYVQNHKTLPQYYESLRQNELPIERGKILQQDDQIRQWVINHLMCQFEIDKEEFRKTFELEFDEYFKEEEDHLSRCREDGLVVLLQEKIKVTDLGKIFIRNVCMGFDWYLRQTNAHRRFSRTV